MTRSLPACLRPVAEAMERRILHSADIAPLLLGGAGVYDAAALQTAQPDIAVARQEIVFVDATLPDAGQLLADLQAQRSAGRPLEIVTLAGGEDGLLTIGRTLAGRQDIAAVHVLTHGADGLLQLGSTSLDAQTLMQRAGEVAAWSTALAPDADLLLYGCDLAQTDAGRQFVRDLAALTGADVAASADLTGAAALGGNWTLEFTTGSIEAALAPSRWDQAQWQGVLATYTVTTTVDVVGSSLLTGSLRWAIAQANANAGTDTIVFAVNGTFNIAAGSSGGDNNETGDFDITDSVDIVGNGSASTVINGNGLDRVFDVRNSAAVSLTGMTIQGGASNQGAGLRVGNSASLTMLDAVVQNNVGNGASKGGGIYADGSLTLRQTIVQNNGDAGSGDIDGAGIYSAGTLVARDVEIRGNLAAGNKDGGGVYVGNGSFATLENTTLADNQAKRGGGIFNHNIWTTLTNVTLSGNTASSEGGGLWTDRFVTFDHVTVAGNAAPAGEGGGLFDNGVNAQVRNSLFAGNVGGNANHVSISLGYNLSDDNSLGFVGVGDLRNVAADAGALASNGGFTRTVSIGAGSAARDAANPVSSLTADQRGVVTFGGRSDIGAYEYNPYGAAPTISTVANQTINEDQALAAVGFTIGDAETDPGSLVLTATSSNTALVRNQDLALGGSGGSRLLTLTPVANASGTAVITVSVSDGGNLTSTSFTLTVGPVNDAPSISLPAPQVLNEDVKLTLAGALAPVIADFDAGSAQVQVSLSVANGKLKLGETTGLSFVSGSPNANATASSMSFLGSLEAVNLALSGLEYRPTDNFAGTDRIQITVNDLGNSGSGGNRITTGGLDLTVQAVNDAPVLTLPGTQSTAQGTPLQFATGNAVRVADVDAGTAALELTLRTDALGNGTLSLTLSGGASLVGGANGSSLLVVRGSQADLNATLESLVFTATSSDPARIDFRLDDLGNSGAGGAMVESGSVGVNVSPNQLPLLSLTRSVWTYTEGDAATPLDPGLTLSDADNTDTLVAATVRITGNHAADEDRLSVVLGADTGDIVVTSNANGVLRLNSAGGATLLQWQAALRTVAYLNLSEAPSGDTRTVGLTVNDGTSDSAEQAQSIQVQSVNDAPVLSGSGSMRAIDEDATTNTGTRIALLVAGQVTDVDAGTQVGIAVTSVVDDNARGRWQYTTDGSVWQDFGSVDEANARLLVADALTSVRFLPVANWHGSVAAGITFRAWDLSAGSAGGTADARTPGPASAFSAAQASADITVRAVNDAPSGSDRVVTIEEDGAHVFGVLDFGFSDPVDAASGSIHALAGVRITTLPAAGRLLLAGVDVGAGQVVTAGDIALGRLVFTPAANASGSGHAAFTFQVQDNGGTDQGGADTDPLPRTLTIDVTAVNDAPTLDNTSLTLPATDEDNANAPTTVADLLAAAGRNDVDSQALQGIAVTATTGRGSWQFSTDGSTWTAVGTVAPGSALLLDPDARLRYLPDARSGETATLQIVAWDRTSGAASTQALPVRADASVRGGSTAFSTAVATASVVVSDVNDAPTGGVTIGGTATQDQTLTASHTLADADGPATVAVSYQWLADSVAISGATGSTLTLSQAQVGKAISVTARYTDTLGTAEAVTSTATAAVANVNDAPTGSVTISGTATQGQTLTASHTLADADGPATLAVSYQWLADSVAISGATGSTLTLSQAQVGKAISVTAGYTDALGTAEAVTSTATAAVANANDAPMGSVTISGTPTQGQTLSASHTLADVDGLGSISYSWRADGSTVGSGSSYLLTEAEVGKLITVVASYTDGHGAAEAVSSAATSAVLNLNDTPTGSVTISGTPTQGQALTASNTLADIDGLGSISYSWQADGSTVGSGSSYVLTEAEVGKLITVMASYTDGHGTAEAVSSAATSAVLNLNDAPSGSVNIAGTPTQGQTLRASHTLADIDGLGVITITWQADGATIGSGGSIVLTEAEVGKAITVVASYTDGHGTVESVSSAATSAVLNVNDAPTGGVTISGTPTQGQTLSASHTLADVDGLGAITYTWQADGSTVGSGGTYILTQTEVGKLISVTARYTDGHGAAESVSSLATSAVLNLNDAPTGSVTITGTPTQGQTLSAANTLADADGLGAIGYQWLADGTAISGATGGTLVLGQAEVGKLITVAARYTDGFGQAESVGSAATTAVANVPEAPTGLPTITGTAIEGQTLAAEVAAIADADGLGAFSYRWLRDGSVVGGATASTYLLGNADVGAQMSVRVSYTDGQGAAESLDSATTLAVLNVNEAPVLSAPLVAQSATQGIPFQFTLPTGSFSDPDIGDTLSYSVTLDSGAALPAWLGFDPAARSFSGTPGGGDLGAINLRVTATDGQGLSAQASLQIITLPVTSPVLAPVVEAPVETAPEPEPEPEAPVAQVSKPAPAAPALPAAVVTAAPPPPLLAPTVIEAPPPAEVRRDNADEAPAAPRLASRSDTVLLTQEALVFGELDASPLSNLLRGDELLRRFDAIRQQLAMPSELQRTAVAQSIAVTSGLSVGYVVWLVRGGVLMSSMLSALPAWQMIDPMPILAAAKPRRADDGPADEDDAEVERLFDKPGPAAADSPVRAAPEALRPALIDAKEQR